MKLKEIIRIINMGANNLESASKIVKELKNGDDNGRVSHLTLKECTMIDKTVEQYGISLNLKNNYFASHNSFPMECDLDALGAEWNSSLCEFDYDDPIKFFSCGPDCDQCEHYVPVKYEYIAPDLTGADDAITAMDNESRRLYDLKDKLLDIFDVPFIGYVQGKNDRFYRNYDIDGFRTLCPATVEEKESIESGKIKLMLFFPVPGKRDFVSKAEIAKAEEMAETLIGEEREKLVRTARALIFFKETNLQELEKAIKA